MSKEKTYRAKMVGAVPVIHHKKDEEHWVARTSTMPIYGTGTTPEEAEQDLMDYLHELVPLLYSRRDKLCRKLKEHLEILLRYFEVEESE